MSPKEGLKCSLIPHTSVWGYLLTLEKPQNMVDKWEDYPYNGLLDPILI